MEPMPEEPDILPMPTPEDQLDGAQAALEEQGKTLQERLRALTALTDNRDDKPRPADLETAARVVDGYAAFEHMWKLWGNRLSQVDAGKLHDAIHEVMPPLSALKAAVAIIERLVTASTIGFSNQDTPASVWEDAVVNFPLLIPEMVEHGRLVAKGLTDDVLGRVEIKEAEVVPMFRGMVRMVNAMQVLVPENERVQIDYEGPAQLEMRCWPEGVYRAVWNLVTNAEKAVRRPGGQSRRVVVRLEQGVSEVRLEVQDFGPGVDFNSVYEAAKEKGVILPDAVDKDEAAKQAMLERGVSGFRQGGGEGTGAGLAACWEIVEVHGGRIDMETAKGVGTTFRIVIPR